MQLNGVPVFETLKVGHDLLKNAGPTKSAAKEFLFCVYA
jgi:hypothetical protein